MHFFNNLKNASKQTNEHRAAMYEDDALPVKEKFAYEFKFDVNPFDKAVLESKQRQIDKAREFLEEQRSQFEQLQRTA